MKPVVTNAPGHDMIYEPNAMTLRDHFAGLAMRALLDLRWADHQVPDIAEEAYVVADAMLAAREPKDPDDCAATLDHGQATERGES